MMGPACRKVQKVKHERSSRASGKPCQLLLHPTKFMNQLHRKGQPFAKHQWLVRVTRQTNTEFTLQQTNMFSDSIFR